MTRGLGIELAGGQPVGHTGRGRCRALKLHRQPARAVHPRLGPDAAKPLRQGRNPAAVLDDVLLCDPADRDLTAGRDPECVSEDPLGFEDALGVVAQRTVAKVAVVFLGLVEPAALMDGEVVAYLPSPFALTTHSVVVGVCHLASPPWSARPPGRPMPESRLRSCSTWLGCRESRPGQRSRAYSQPPSPRGRAPSSRCRCDRVSGWPGPCRSSDGMAASMRNCWRVSVHTRLLWRALDW